MKILAIERDNTACNHYRIMQPMIMLQNHGLAECKSIQEGYELLSDAAINAMLEADVIVFHRPSSKEWFDFINLCQQHGKIIVCDYDDDPFNTSPWNPYYRYAGTKEYKYRWPDGTEEYLWKDGIYGFDIERNIMFRDMFKACFAKADLVTTTTNILAQELRKINPNVKVLPNLINFEEYPTCKIVKTDEVRIGWYGGSSHYEDLHMMHEQVIRALEKNPNAKLVLWGEKRIFPMFDKAPKGQVEIHGWTNQVVFPYKLATLNIDIALCPVVDNEFNRNKSAIKYFENSVFKSASIASAIPPYSPVITDGKDGLLVKDDQWFDALDLLINNKEERIAMGERAYENVYQNHNANKDVKLWYDAYAEVLHKKVSV